MNKKLDKEECVKWLKELIMRDEALEPIKIDNDLFSYRLHCPSCNSPLEEEIEYGFCPVCGQHIDYRYV